MHCQEVDCAYLTDKKYYKQSAEQRERLQYLVADKVCIFLMAVLGEKVYKIAHEMLLKGVLCKEEVKEAICG